MNFNVSSNFDINKKIKYKCNICNGKLKYITKYSVLQNLYQICALIFWRIIKIINCSKFFNKNFYVRCERILINNFYFKNRYWGMCLNCDIFQVIPHLSKEELSKYYQDYGNLRPGYYSELRSNKRVIEQFNLIDKFTNLNKKNYLEYGSGNCIALRYVLDRYNLNTIKSVDPSVHTNRICSTLDIKNYSDLNKLKNNSIDFIFTSHALEHLSSLKEFLLSIDTILSLKGELFVEVPDIPDENILKNRFHLPHTYAFNLKSLLKVCGKYGFKLKSESSFEFADKECLRLILCRN